MKKKHKISVSKTAQSNLEEDEYAKISKLHWNSSCLSLLYYESEIVNHAYLSAFYVVQNSVTLIIQIWNVNEANQQIIDLMVFVFLPDKKDMWKEYSNYLKMEL